MSNRAAALTVATAGIALAVSGCGFQAHIGPRSITDDASVTAPLTAVQLAAGSGDIKIRTGPDTGATIHRTMSYRGSARPQPSQHVVAGVLTFTADCAHCSIDYDLTVPAAADVRIRTGSGSISVIGVAAADIQTGSGDVGVRDVHGAVQAHTGSGSVTVNSVGAQTTLHTSSGDIIATSVGGGTLLADTGSGSVVLKFSAAPTVVRAITGSGDLFITVPGGPYRVAPSTGSGDQYVAVPTSPNAAASIVAQTGSGSLTIASPTAAGRPARPARPVRPPIPPIPPTG